MSLSLNLKPVRDRIIVKLDQPKPLSDTIQVVAAQNRGQWQTGEVIAIGPKVTEFEVGHRVCFIGFNGSDLEILNEGENKYKTLPQDDVAFVIEGEVEIG